MRNRFASEIYEKVAKRLDVGAAEHGDTFAGDPLDQLEEELLDALFYIHYERKRRGHEGKSLTTRPIGRYDDT